MRKFFLLLNFSIIIIFSALLLSTHPAEPSPEPYHQLSVQSSPDETARNESCPFYTLLSYGNRSYRIDVWEKEPYCYYLFLPGWISSSRDKYEPKIFTTKDIRIGDEESLQAVLLLSISRNLLSSFRAMQRRCEYAIHQRFRHYGLKRRKGNWRKLTPPKSTFPTSKYRC